ncbi:MAG: excalibur calcium-binding domain-containing protein [Parasphingorhabdus sp.]
MAPPPAAPLYRGDPGYRRSLDRDGDGVACEPYRGR